MTDILFAVTTMKVGQTSTAGAAREGLGKRRYLRAGGQDHILGPVSTPGFATDGFTTRLKKSGPKEHRLGTLNFSRVRVGMTTFGVNV